MYLPLVQHVVHTETQSDRLSKMQYQNLTDIIARDRRQNRSDRKVFRWFGTQMIAWGTKLQGPQNIDTGCQETTFHVSVTAY